MPSALVLLTASFAFGIAVRESASLPCWATVAAVIALAMALTRAWRLGRSLGVLSMGLATGLGALAAASAWPHAPAGLLDGKPWDVTAHVVEVDAGYGQTHVIASLEAVTRDDAARPASGLVQVSLDGAPVEPLLPGDRVRFHARLAAPHGFVEPDAPDPARRFAARGVMAVAGVGEAASLARLVDKGPAHVPWRSAPAALAGSWRARMMAVVNRHLEGERRALVASLVLGDRSGIDPALDDAFRAAGVTHVLSVSGLHLAAAAFLSFVLLRWLLLRVTPLARRVPVRRVAAALSIASVIAYTLVTGAAVATVRACVASVIYFSGTALGRPASSATAIAGAALLILAASPLTLYDPSFQLSFAATLGCALLAPPLLARTRPLCRTGRWESTIAARLAGWLVRAALGVIVVSAAATAATAPLTAWHFAQVPPAGLVANVLVVPLAELFVLPLGLAGCLLGLVSDGAGGLLLHPAGAGAAAMAAIVRWFAAWAPSGKVPAPSLAGAALWYATLGAAVLATRLDGSAARRRARQAAVALAVLLVALPVGNLVRARLRPTMRVTFLDVGQGDSCLVEFPGGPTLLVDGGGSFDERFDPGARVLVPWLERHGVRRLDVVALTHPHPDHANGLAAVVDRFAVGEVWTNGAASALPGLARLEQAAARRGTPVVRPHRLETTSGARVDVLHPLVRDAPVAATSAAAPPRELSENDGSIVLRLRYGGRAVLLTGDVERRAEALLVDHARAPRSDDDDPSLRADVIKAPHHCSRTSSTAPFVEAVIARVAVCSVGQNNRWGFPAAEVVERWERVGARVWRTDRDGAVTVRIARSGAISVEGAR